MNNTPLLDELSRRPLVCDGAIGTQLLARGLTSGECGILPGGGRLQFSIFPRAKGHRRLR